MAKKFFLHALNYGLILTGVQVLLQLLIYIFDVDIFNILVTVLMQLATVVFITWWMAWSCIKFRDKQLEGRITFLQCWLMGISVGLVATVLVSLYSYVFYAFFDPEALQHQAEKAIEMIENNEYIPEDDKPAIIEGMADKFTPLKILRQSLTYSGTMAVVLSLLASLFVRKKEKSADAL
jgi:hypothetical protein